VLNSIGITEQQGSYYTNNQKIYPDTYTVRIGQYGPFRVCFSFNAAQVM
jgi:hypothetical protein